MSAFFFPPHIRSAVCKSSLDGAVLLPFHTAGMAAAMQITSTEPQTIQKALGEAVTLGCTYLPGISDTGELDIEWSIISPDMTQKDRLVRTVHFKRNLLFSTGCLFHPCIMMMMMMMMVEVMMMTFILNELLHSLCQIVLCIVSSQRNY